MEGIGFSGHRLTRATLEVVKTAKNLRNLDTPQSKSKSTHTLLHFIETGVTPLVQRHEMHFGAVCASFWE